MKKENDENGLIRYVDNAIDAEFTPSELLKNPFQIRIYSIFRKGSNRRSVRIGLLFMVAGSMIMIVCAVLIGLFFERVSGLKEPAEVPDGMIQKKISRPSA